MLCIAMGMGETKRINSAQNWYERVPIGVANATAMQQNSPARKMVVFIVVARPCSQSKTAARASPFYRQTRLATYASWPLDGFD